MKYPNIQEAWKKKEHMPSKRISLRFSQVRNTYSLTMIGSSTQSAFMLIHELMPKMATSTSSLKSRCVFLPSLFAKISPEEEETEFTNIWLGSLIFTEVKKDWRLQNITYQYESVQEGTNNQTSHEVVMLIVTFYYYEANTYLWCLGSLLLIAKRSANSYIVR